MCCLELFLASRGARDHGRPWPVQRGALQGQESHQGGPDAALWFCEARGEGRAKPQLPLGVSLPQLAAPLSSVLVLLFPLRGQGGFIISTHREGTESLRVNFWENDNF